MKKDLNWLVLIADRSGSMSTIANEMEKGIKNTIQEQKRNCKGKILVTGVTFDDHRDLLFKNIFVLFRGYSQFIVIFGSLMASF